MKPARLLLAVLIGSTGCFGLAGCGQMGPLTLPDKSATATTSTPADQDRADEDQPEQGDAENER